MMSDTEKLLLTIDRERRRQNMSMTEFSKKVGISYHTFYYWLNRGQNETIDKLMRMLNILGLEIKIVRKVKDGGNKDEL